MNLGIRVYADPVCLYEMCSESNAQGEITSKRISLENQLFQAIFQHSRRPSRSTFCFAPSTSERLWRSHPGGWTGWPHSSSPGSFPGSLRGQPAQTSTLGRARSPWGRGPLNRVDGKSSGPPLPPGNSELRRQYGLGHCRSAGTTPGMT